MVTGNQEFIRDMNSHLVLHAILQNGAISRAAIAKQLGLTKATVSSIVQTFLDHHLIQEIGSQNTEKGRKPILLRFLPDAGNVISIDLSVDHITVLLSNLKGEHCTIAHYQMDVSSAHLIHNLTKILQNTMHSMPDAPYGVVGISLGIHGVVHQNQIQFTPYYDLIHLNLAEELERIFSIPVYIENEANLSVLGEKAFCHPYSNMVNISVHTGIGIGIIIEDQLYTGFNGYAGEFGHTILIPDGKPCPCGNHGCLEQYASERALLQNRDVRAFFHAYLTQQPEEVAIVEKFVQYISIGINNILYALNPQIIVINSSFTSFIPNLTDTIQQKLQKKTLLPCTIVSSHLQDKSVLLGGVSVCTKHFLGMETPIILS